MIVWEANRPRFDSAQVTAWIGGLGVMVAAKMLPLFWARGIQPIPPCVFHMITGHPCPLCGATRSFVAMARGDPAAAWRHYPLGPLLFLGLALALVYVPVAMVLGRRASLRVSSTVQRACWTGAGAALAASWSLKWLWLGY